jgi:spore maturation protein CgeB
MNLNIVVFGLSITSSWGNGHASTYRALIKAAAGRGHRVTFAERNVPWYRRHRDLADPGYCRVKLYDSLQEVAGRFGRLVSEADLVILGSYVPDGAVLGDWITSHARGITAFYDIDTPVTLAKLDAGSVDYIASHLIPRFDLFLSFTGGPSLTHIEHHYGARRARALYCAADMDLHAPAGAQTEWNLGYLGTYSADRQQPFERLLIEPALKLPQHRFVVAGAQYPAARQWPANVAYVEHIPPEEHAAFYGSQRYTLNITRADMAARGYSPSVRLFEAAACGVPIISDRWSGLETFFVPGQEILIVDQATDVIEILTTLPNERRFSVAAAARKRLLTSHTAEHRAKNLEEFYIEALEDSRPKIEEVVA